MIVHVRGLIRILSIVIFFFFFFSSRRRHTRYWRDWSSDVCSSDLEPLRALWVAQPFVPLFLTAVHTLGHHRPTWRQYTSYSSPKVRRSVGSSYKTTKTCVARKNRPA